MRIEMKVYQTNDSDGTIEQRERAYIADGMMSVLVTGTEDVARTMVKVDGVLSGTLDDTSVTCGLAALAAKYMEVTEMNAVEKLRFIERAIKEMLFYRGESA